MSDGRWLDIERAAGEAVQLFDSCIRFFDRGRFDETGLDPFWAGMGFMHAMQSAHTSLEGALLRVFDVLGEDRPRGEQWHRDLIERACHPVAGPQARPALLSERLCKAIDETRRFRNLAVRGYGRFDAVRAAPAVDAARIIAESFVAELADFRNRIDGP